LHPLTFEELLLLHSLHYLRRNQPMHPYIPLVLHHKLTFYYYRLVLFQTSAHNLCKHCLFLYSNHKTLQDYLFPSQPHLYFPFSIYLYLSESLRLCSMKISFISLSYLFAMTATLPNTSPSSSVKFCLLSFNEIEGSSGRSLPISSALIARATSPVSSAKKPIRTKTSKSAQPLT